MEYNGTLGDLQMRNQEFCRKDAPWQVTLVLDNLRSAYNVGNIFRLAEALQCEVIACGATPAPPHPVLAKTAMGTDRMVRCRIAPDAAEAVALLRAEGCGKVLAVECTPESVEAWQYEEYLMPLALVLGNEAHGIAPEVLASCDGAVSLPMFGKKSSINVGNAAAAVLYAVDAKIRRKCL